MHRHTQKKGCALSHSLTHFNIPLGCVCPQHNLGAPWHSKKKCLTYHLHLASAVTFLHTRDLLHCVLLSHMQTDIFIFH